MDNKKAVSKRVLKSYRSFDRDSCFSADTDDARKGDSDWSFARHVRRVSAFVVRGTIERVGHFEPAQRTDCEVLPRWRLGNGRN